MHPNGHHGQDIDDTIGQCKCRDLQAYTRKVACDYVFVLVGSNGIVRV